MLLQQVTVNKIHIIGQTGNKPNKKIWTILFMRLSHLNSDIVCSRGFWKTVSKCIMNYETSLFYDYRTEQIQEHAIYNPKFNTDMTA